MPNPFDYGGGIASFLSGLGGGGGAPMDPRKRQLLLRPDQLDMSDPAEAEYARRPDKLRAVPTPTNAPPSTPGGMTKTDMQPPSTPDGTPMENLGGGSPYDVFQPQPGPTIAQAWQGVPYRVPGTPGYSPVEREEDRPHIRVGIGGNGLSDYLPDEQEDEEPLMAGMAESRARGFMGRPGLPQGGGFSPSQQNWANVANPEAFDEYTAPIRRNLRDAEVEHSRRLAADPYADQRAEADIWRETQLGLQQGIRQQMWEEYQNKAAQIEQSVRQDPAWQAKGEQEMQNEIVRRLSLLQDEISGVFGRSGMAGTAPRSYSGYPD